MTSSSFKKFKAKSIVKLRILTFPLASMSSDCLFILSGCVYLLLPATPKLLYMFITVFLHDFTSLSIILFSITQTFSCVPFSIPVITRRCTSSISIRILIVQPLVIFVMLYQHCFNSCPCCRRFVLFKAISISIVPTGIPMWSMMNSLVGRLLTH